MKILVTGASGYVGNKLAHALANRNIQVHALIRTATAACTLQHPNITIFKGDLLDNESLSVAMQGCEQVYHTASMVKMWTKYPAVFHQQNVTGTANVLDIALREGVQKLVYTSTCGVWSSSSGRTLNENDAPASLFETDYDRTKYLAEQLVESYSSKGLPGMIVSLPRVFGPGILRYSSGINRFIIQLLRNKISLLPWDLGVQANYVFTEDAVRGHILAMENGSSGERYILGGENVSYKRFTDTVSALSGNRNIPLRVPPPLLKAWSWIELLKGKLTKYEPAIVPGIAKRLQEDKVFDCSKAVEKLGYHITPFEKAMYITIEYLNGQLQMQSAIPYKEIPVNQY